MKRWRRLKSRLLVRSTLFRLYQDEYRTTRGHTVPYTRLEGPSFASVVPVNQAREIIFVENYRPLLRRSLLEIPGGMIDPGETPREAARRELEEETGFRAGRLQALGWYYPSPHLARHRGHLFLGTDLTRGRTHRDPDEEIRVVPMAIHRAYRLLEEGKIHQSTAMLGLDRARPYVYPPPPGGPSSRRSAPPPAPEL